MYSKAIVFVKGYPQQTKKQQLQRLFQRFGTIRQIRMTSHYSFVSYANLQSAKASVEQLNHTNFHNQNLLVELSAKNNHKKKQTKQQHSKKVDTCNNCGQIGHWARNCSKPKKIIERKTHQRDTAHYKQRVSFKNQRQRSREGRSDRRVDTYSRKSRSYQYERRRERSRQRRSRSNCSYSNEDGSSSLSRQQKRDKNKAYMSKSSQIDRQDKKDGEKKQSKDSSMGSGEGQSQKRKRNASSSSQRSSDSSRSSSSSSRSSYSSSSS